MSVLLGALMLSMGGIAAAAGLCERLVCEAGTGLTGGGSTPMTATSGDPIVYNIWAVDRDQPQGGGPEVPDTSTFVAGRQPETLALRVVVQGDDPPTGKRTFTASGRAPVMPTTTIVKDYYTLDDLFYDEHTDRRYKYGDDPRSGWYARTITVKPAPGVID